MFCSDCSTNVIFSRCCVPSAPLFCNKGKAGTLRLLRIVVSSRRYDAPVVPSQEERYTIKLCKILYMSLIKQDKKHYICNHKDGILPSFEQLICIIIAQTAMTVRMDNQQKIEFDRLC